VSQSASTIQLGSLNVEGFRRNIECVQYLMKQCDILCIQEHWLWDFEKDVIGKIDPDFRFVSRSADLYEPVLPISRRTGKGGVAIIWKSNMSPLIQELPDGNERIVCIELCTAREKLCIVAVYLPSQSGSSSLAHLDECLDLLSEIVFKYGETHELVMAGDWNASLIRDKQQDRFLKEFVKQHDLVIPGNLGSSPTYRHHNGLWVSQIDYILVRQDQSIVSSAHVVAEDHINVSTHQAVMCDVVLHDIGTSVSRHVQKCARVKKFQWELADSSLMAETFTNLLPTCFLDNNDTPDIEAGARAIMDALNGAADLVIPSQTVKLQGPRRRASPALLEKIKQSKLALNMWRGAGRPGPLHQTSRDRKAAKRAVRHQQRMEEVQDREAFYNQMMADVNTRNMHKLIRRQRNREPDSPAIRVHGELCLDPVSQVEGWAGHFKELGTPHEDPRFDQNYLKLVEESVDTISTLTRQSRIENPYTIAEVENAIDNLNTGKSADEWQIVAEHLKTAKVGVARPLLELLNAIRVRQFVPESLKSGVITPIGKKDKSKLEMGNYRGITITAVLGKVLEMLLLGRMKNHQSTLQFGFTKGLSPGMAAMLLSESIAESKEAGQSVYVCTLDAVKAFDTVHHAVLLRKLFAGGLDLESWGIIQSLYEGGCAKVKWKGLLSDIFTVGQGVRQGGVLSPDLYKTYINDLLTSMEYEGLGKYIGTTYVGTPTVADDVLLVSDSPIDLQLMMQRADQYSCRERYHLHPQKSAIVQFSRTRAINPFVWNLAGNELSPVEQAVHLGVTHQGAQVGGHRHAEWIRDKIKRTRRTVYGLIGSGLHGNNGLDAYTSVRIYQAYALPKLLYGLEVTAINAGQLAALEQFHLKTLKQVTSLPERTASEAVYLLLGISTVQALVHVRRLSLIGAIARSDNVTLHELAIRQCALKAAQSDSWFVNTEMLLIRYGLPSTLQLLHRPPSKYQWKKEVKRAVNSLWKDKLIQDCADKSSLRYMNLNDTDFGRCHPCWRSVSSNVKDVRRAVIKSKLLTGTYLTQDRLARYSKNNLDSTCPLCKMSVEDTAHFLTKCPATYSARVSELTNIATLTASYVGAAVWASIAETDDLVQLILDATLLIDRGLLPPDATLLERLEWHSRRLCYSTHCRRAHLIMCAEAGGEDV
jgi:hypothetical protein